LHSALCTFVSTGRREFCLPSRRPGISVAAPLRRHRPGDGPRFGERRQEV
jgi:hypothetical protein